MIEQTVPAVSVALRRGDRVLLVKRRHPPSRGFYAFPGGRVEAGETNEAAARRELFEETGMRARAMTPLRTYRIEAQKGDLAVVYSLEVFIGIDDGGEPEGASDAEEAGFYTLAEMEALPMSDSVLEVARDLLAQAQ